MSSPGATLIVMLRPCFLVIDREFRGSISTRKLIIETAKFNVLTAYSALEAIHTLKAFPNVDGIVMDADLYGMSCQDLVAALKAIKPKIPIVAISGPGDQLCPGADWQLESFNPGELLNLLRKLQPEQVVAIEKHEEELNREQS